MSSSVNKVILVGRLGKDPEVRYTQAGKAVANFSLATDESYKNNDGEKVKKVEWHNLVVWGNSVENFVQPYLHKGDLVYVEGKLQTRKWTDKNDVERYTMEVNVFDIKSFTPKSETATQNNPHGEAKPARRPAPPEVSDEDIPF